MQDLIYHHRQNSTKNKCSDHTITNLGCFSTAVSNQASIHDKLNALKIFYTFVAYNWKHKRP